MEVQQRLHWTERSIAHSMPKYMHIVILFICLAIDASGIKNSRLSYGIEQFLNEIKQEFMRLANGLGVSSE